MSQVDVLYRLQRTDDEIRQDTKRLGVIARQLQGTDELAQAREALNAAEKTLHVWRGQQTDLNLELRSLNDKARRSENRLYSGAVTNPKELADLQLELESLGRRREHLEDELLEAMIMVEESQEAQDEADRTVSELEAGWANEVQSLKQEQISLARRLKELNAQRAQLAEMATPQGLAVYADAQRRTGIPVVVGLRNGRCLGCQVTVPAHRGKAAHEGQLVYCDSCGRILCPV